MQMTNTGKGIKVTAAMRDYAQKKFAKLEEFFGNIVKVEIILETKKIDDVEHSQIAEVRAWLAGKKMVQAIEAGRDIYAAIDLVLEEAKRQVQKHKEKLVDSRRHAENPRHNLADQSVAEISDDGQPQIIASNQFINKPMDLAEAKAELKVLDREFLAFRNRETKEVNVLQKNNNSHELLSAKERLHPKEAVQALIKSKKNLIIFTNKATNAPSVVFRRKAGNFGMIEP